MALPVGDKDAPWPPTSARAAYIRYGEWSAWYSGSPQELTRFYAGYAGQDRTGFFDPQTTAQPYVSVWRRYMFWARQTPGAITRHRLHVPLAADIATTSSDQLWADPPALVIPQAHVAKAKKDAKASQDRLDEIAQEDGVFSTFAEGGEVAAALGGCFIRAVWDTPFAPDRPLLDVVHPDAALPEFLWGVLTAVTFWQVVLDDGRAVYRLLQRHEPGHVLHGLYKGTSVKLGIQVPLSQLPVTSVLSSDVQATQADIETGIDGLTAVYVPNMRPQRVERASPLGRSDFSGVEGLMDSLDETWSSWLRDIRLGRARMLVPEEYTQVQKRGQGSSFDLDREVWEILKMLPKEGGQIQMQQFQIRTQEHSATADALVERIVATAGYSGSTFGLKSAATVEKTATEVKAREHRSLVTRGKKAGYWARAVADILEVLLELDVVHFGGKSGDYRPRIDFPDTVRESTIDMANAVSLLRAAKAISLQTAVEMAHPDWDPDEIASELERIAQEGATAPTVDLGSVNQITPLMPPVSPPGGPAVMPTPMPGGPMMPPGTQGAANPAPPISQPAQP